MANKKVNIEITTTSNTSGADKTTASLDKIAAQQAKAEAKAQEIAAREAARTARSEAAAQKAADVETRRQERLSRQAEVAVQRKEAALRREEVAMARAQAAAEKAAQATERANQKAIAAAEALAKKTEQVVTTETANESRLAQLAEGKAKRQTASKLQQAGFQVADIATQVSGGTSLLQSFSQQAPQLLGAFGPTGAIAGAFVALGALALKTFIGIGDNTKLATENADMLTEGIKKIGAAAAEEVGKDWDFGRAAFKISTDLANALGEAVRAVGAAQDELKLKTAQNAQDQNAMLKQLYDLQGRKPDELKDLLRQKQELQNIEAIKTQNAQNDIARQKQVAEATITTAQKQVTDAESRKQKAIEELSAKEKVAEKDQAELRVLDRKKTKLQEIETFVGSIKALWTEAEGLQKLALLAQPGVTAAAAMTVGQQAGYAGKAVTADMQPVLARLSKLESAITEYEKALDPKIGALETAVTQAQANLETTQIAQKAQIDILGEKAKSEEVSGKLAQVKIDLETTQKTGTEIATSLETAVQGISGTLTTDQQKNLDILTGLLSDHQLKADEIAKANAALSSLGPLLDSALKVNNQNLTLVVQKINQYDADMKRLQGILEGGIIRQTTQQPQGK